MPKIKLSCHTNKESIELINKILQDHGFSTIATDDGLSVNIQLSEEDAPDDKGSKTSLTHLTNDLSATPNQDTDEKNSGKSLKNRAKVSRLNEILDKHDVPMPKRKYTKKEDRNYPELPHDHDANRSDSRFNARIDNETNLLATEYLKATKMTKKELTVRAIRAFIEQNPPEI